MKCTGKPVEFFRISESTPGAILQPQPPPWEKEVSLIFWSGAFIGDPVRAAMAIRKLSHAPEQLAGERQDGTALGCRRE